MLTATAFVSFDPISDYSPSSCEHIITGSLNNDSESVIVSFELNSTELVWISTCASSFDTSFELHRKDADLVLHSIGVYDHCSFTGGLQDEPSITNKTEASIEMSAGHYGLEIKPVSPGQSGTFHVVMGLYQNCASSSDSDGPEWVGRLVAGLFIGIPVSALFCGGICCVVAYRNERQSDPDEVPNEHRTDADPKDEELGPDQDERCNEKSDANKVVVETQADSVVDMPLISAADSPMIGRWIAGSWSDNVERGGDPDPFKDERVAVVSAGSDGTTLSICFPNGMDEPKKLTMTNEHRGYIVTREAMHFLCFSASREIVYVSYRPADEYPLLVEFHYDEKSSVQYGKE